MGFTSHALTARGSAQKRPKEAKRGLGDIWKKYLGFDVWPACIVAGTNASFVPTISSEMDGHQAHRNANTVIM